MTTHQTVRCLLLGAVAAVLASCSSPAPQEVVVHHHHYHPDVEHHTSTAPADYGVVNQYDRQSR